MFIFTNLFSGDLSAVGRKFVYALIPRKSTTLLQQWDLWGPLILSTTLAILLQSNPTKGSNGVHFAEVFTLMLIGSIAVTVSWLDISLRFFSSRLVSLIEREIRSICAINVLRISNVFFFFWNEFSWIPNYLGVKFHFFNRFAFLVTVFYPCWLLHSSITSFFIFQPRLHFQYYIFYVFWLLCAHLVGQCMRVLPFSDKLSKPIDVY